MNTIVISSNTSWYIYNFRKNTILSLISCGYKVIAICPRDEYSEKIHELGCEFIHLDIDQGGTNPIKDINTFINFLIVYSKVKPSVVLNFTPKNNIYSTLAAKFCNAKVINNIAGLGMVFINESLTAKLARILYKISQRKADKIFFQNEDDKKLFLDNKLVDESITERIPGSGVDLTRFTLQSADDDGVVRFLLIARMLYDKGVGHYVESARILKAKYGDTVEFQLLGFVGVKNPSAVTELEMKAWVDEGVVNYLGTSDCVEEVISQIDCMVLPSFYREGVPKSLLEAGAMGKPIVTTDNVGCRETVDDGINGFLCETRSTVSLVDALEKIIQMTHEDRLIMGKASRAKIEREFNEQIIINTYLDAVKECLTEH